MTDIMTAEETAELLDKCVTIVGESGDYGRRIDASSVIRREIQNMRSTIEALRAVNAELKKLLDINNAHAVQFRDGAYGKLATVRSAAEERIAYIQHALADLLDEHDTCDTGEGSPEGCTLLADLREVYQGSFPTTESTGGNES